MITRERRGAPNCWYLPNLKIDLYTVMKSEWKSSAKTRGSVSFQIASLYPVLYRLERKGLIAGRWVEKAGQRRRRYYKLTPAGHKFLSEQRRSWSEFVAALQAAGGLEHA